MVSRLLPDFWVLAVCLVLSFNVAGCGRTNTKEIEIAPAFNNLRLFKLAYQQATDGLKHPPRSAEEIKPYLAKLGDPKELLRSPADGQEFVVHWGVRMSDLKPQGDRWPIWVYEKSSHEGKRWVLQERNVELMTDEQFQAGLFAPGFKASK